MIGVSGKRISIAAIAAALMAPPWTRVNAALGTNDPLACDNFWITITNQTQVDFYKTCPVISSGLFYIDPKFSGPFNAPGIESTSELIAGFYGPKLGDGDDRAENFVTSISMPDLKNTTGGHGVSLGYLEHLTNVSLPRLETTAALFVAGTPGIRNLTLPSLSVATSGVYLDGHFDVIDLPSLKSAAWIKVLSLGNLSCPALATAWATVNLTGTKDDLYQGFTCWTGYADNSWDSTDPKHNPKGGPVSSNSGSSSGSSSGSGSTKDNKSAANTLIYGHHWLSIVILFSLFSL